MVPKNLWVDIDSSKMIYGGHWTKIIFRFLRLEPSDPFVFLSFSTIKCPLSGPLTMYPAAEDNYGTDACSIVCLDTTPQVLVISTCSGKLYHCVLLPSPDDECDTTVSQASNWWMVPSKNRSDVKTSRLSSHKSHVKPFNFQEISSKIRL